MWATSPQSFSSYLDRYCAKQAGVPNAPSLPISSPDKHTLLQSERTSPPRKQVIKPEFQSFFKSEFESTDLSLASRPSVAFIYGALSCVATTVIG